MTTPEQSPAERPAEPTAAPDTPDDSAGRTADAPLTAEQRAAAVAALAKAIGAINANDIIAPPRPRDADLPADDLPADDGPVADGPSTGEPSAEQPSAGQPSTGVPSADAPSGRPAGGPVDGPSARPVRRPAAPLDAAGAPVDDAQRKAALAAVTEVLAAGGAPADLAAPALAALGEGAAEQLREDPWAVLSLPGVRPEHADGFAKALLGPAAQPGDQRRAQALVSWLLEQAALRGHSAQELGEVAEALRAQRVPDPEGALQAVLVDGRVMPFQEELPMPPGSHDEDEEPPVRTMLALERLALAEESLGEGLVRLLSTFVPGGDAAAAEDGVEDGAEAGAEDRVEDGAEAGAEGASAQPGPAAWEEAAAAAPSPSAQALVRAAAGSGLVLHTGGEAARAEPAALLHAAAGLGLRAWAATWTGQGRDALAALLPEGSPAAGRIGTLNDLLYGADVPRAVDGTLELDVLVVLDAPLLDVETAATLLEAVADGARLVLSGDPEGLWSAGPGRFFADLRAAKTCPAVASRTPDPGPIGELVSGVGVGELQPVDAPDKEVVILTARDGGEAVHRAVQLLTDSIPRALSVPSEQTVLLTPGHGGPAGTRALNAAAKARLNPGPGRFGGFDPGDRVVHSPALGVSLPGRVLDGDAGGLHVELADGGRITLTPAQARKLRHGWAVTAHQAVGRRWPAVVVVLPPEAAGQLTRQWVYSAFGRAERHLSVVHAAGPALDQAVTERPAQDRTTRLRSVLTAQ
ncbi:helix-hairpin-helix domain-containing protein [Kitasatospora phosalacinea]|uniref:helix-hairpin-helix domain-containing protein n=1 Tax=Kitasatospora phosalacinea TaxID=2065 RepID=UPI000524FDEA|nr:helix-hairpin-helix domain-containing protein [Kitasatospora phosalacinea]